MYPIDRVSKNSHVTARCYDVHFFWPLFLSVVFFYGYTHCLPWSFLFFRLSGESTCYVTFSLEEENQQLNLELTKVRRQLRESERSVEILKEEVFETNASKNLFQQYVVPLALN